MSRAAPVPGPKAVVIGSGSAGLTVAVGLARLGHRVVVVERGPVGGDCTNVGCIPSKTLLHLAATGAADPWPAVRDRRDGLEADESAMLEAHDRIELIRGAARVVGPGEVDVTDAAGGRRRVQAANVVIATGSEPVPITVPGLPAGRSLTNETLFELSATPGNLAILGGGAIAVEMATAVHDLGGRATSRSGPPPPTGPTPWLDGWCAPSVCGGFPASARPPPSRPRCSASRRWPRSASPSTSWPGAGPRAAGCVSEQTWPTPIGASPTT